MVRFPRSTVYVVLFYAIISVILRSAWSAINNPSSVVTWRGTRCHHTKQECSEWVDGYWHLRCPARCNCRGHRHGECIQSTSCNSLLPYKSKSKTMAVYNGKPIMVAVVLMGMLLLSSVMAFGDTFLEDYLNRGPCYQHKSNCEGYGLKSCRYKCQCEGYAGGSCVHVGVQTCMSFTPYHCVCHGRKIKLLPRLCRL